jgi:hypothetical protein
MIINGYWWNVEETNEGITAKSGPHSAFFDKGTTLEEVYSYLQERY